MLELFFLLQCSVIVSCIYVAFSRVTSKKDIKVLVLDGEENPMDTTTNVVYIRVFQKPMRYKINVALVI